MRVGNGATGACRCGYGFDGCDGTCRSVWLSHTRLTRTQCHTKTQAQQVKTPWSMRHGGWGAVDTTRGQAYKVCLHLFIFIVHTDYMNLRHVIPCHVDLRQSTPPCRPALHQKVLHCVRWAPIILLPPLFFWPRCPGWFRMTQNCRLRFPVLWGTISYRHPPRILLNKKLSRKTNNDICRCPSRSRW